MKETNSFRMVFTQISDHLQKYFSKRKERFVLFGIKFAPLHLPIERRLQTLAAGFLMCALCSGWFFVLLSIYILVFTDYWLLAALYWIWVYYDRDIPHTGGRKFKCAQRWSLWKYAVDYFPTKLVKTAELPPVKNYLLCVYPHGVLSISSFLNFCTEANGFQSLYPGVEPYRATLDLNFNAPLTREFYLSTGNCASSEKSIVTLLQRKRPTACVLIVGGAAESMMAYPGTYKILLNRRRGFVRLALQTGASLVPVISFGENDLFDQYTSEKIVKIQDYFRNMTSISPILIKGRGLFQYNFGIIPRRCPVNTVVGKPIDVPKVENPSKELISEYREKFVIELKKLFEDNKEKFDKSGREVHLEIY